MKKNILIVDDEKDILDLLRYNLQKEEYEVITASDGEEALSKDFTKIDLILLDIMIPKLDGFEVCRQLKLNELTAKIPIIFLTAKNNIIDEVRGLEIGANDYIVKPISMLKLNARIKNVLRREEQDFTQKSILFLEDVFVDTNNYSVKINNAEIQLTKKEFDSLVFLIRNRGKIVSRNLLLKAIWGDRSLINQRTVDVHIKNIREKLGDRSSLLETIKGIGYRIKPAK